MSPQAKGQNLLYVSSAQGKDVAVFTYPGGRQVGDLTGLASPRGICSDAVGNVWVTDNYGGPPYSGSVVEYRHGGTSPITTLDDPGQSPLACSVDPTTGNVAVANGCTAGECDSDMAIYSGGQGQATIYNSGLGYPSTITYDDAGNVFEIGYSGVYQHGVAWLAAGASQVEPFVLRPRIPPRESAWDGEHLVIRSGHGPFRRYIVQNGAGKGLHGRTVLSGCCSSLFWIQGDTIMAASNENTIAFWPYPGGGAATRNVSVPNRPYSLTVSLARRKGT